MHPNRVTCQWEGEDGCPSIREQSQGATLLPRGQELCLCGVGPLGPLIKRSDFSGHLAFVFCTLLLYLSYWVVLLTSCDSCRMKAGDFCATLKAIT